jgi:DNA-directed RNA polymerase subunit M/transcription elongation factor TFIIS
MARLRLAEDEAVNARETSMRRCPKCKKRTPHAFTVQIRDGTVVKGWQCLRCGHTHN